MTPEQIIATIVVQFPLVVGLVIAIKNEYLISGPSHKAEIASLKESFARELEAQDENHKREMAAKDAEIAFREALRQETLVDKKATEAKEAEGRQLYKDIADVVQRTLDFNERLVSEELRRFASERAAGYPRPAAPRRTRRDAKQTAKGESGSPSN